MIAEFIKLFHLFNSIALKAPEIVSSSRYLRPKIPPIIMALMAIIEPIARVDNPVIP
jgi:hypothetical protein